jgi:hypothetical protein
VKFIKEHTKEEIIDAINDLLAQRAKYVAMVEAGHPEVLVAIQFIDNVLRMTGVPKKDG